MDRGKTTLAGHNQLKRQPIPKYHLPYIFSSVVQNKTQ
jgi:hypothetical protein